MKIEIDNKYFNDITEKVKEVKSGRELPFNQSQSRLEEETQFVLQVRLLSSPVFSVS